MPFMNWLLLRGLSREQRHWGAFPVLLSGAVGGEVLCLDAPGFGTEHERLSPRTVSEITDDVRGRWLRGQGDGSWAVLGISLGGMVALDWVDRYPSDFKRCVVINTSSSDAPILQRFRLPGVRSALLRGFRSAEANERAVLAISSNRTDLNRDTITLQWAAWAAERPPRGSSVTNQVAAAIRFGAPAALSVPLLVLGSRGDRLVSNRCSQRIAARLNATLLLHDSAGHDLPLDDPDWTCEQIAAWANTTPPGAL